MATRYDVQPIARNNLFPLAFSVTNASCSVHSQYGANSCAVLPMLHG